MGTKLYVGTTAIDLSNNLTTVANDIGAFTAKSPPVGDDILVIDDSGASYAKKKAKISALVSSNFGGFVHVVSDDSFISTTSTSYQDALTLTSWKDMPAGDYVLFWNAWTYLSYGSNAELYVRVNFVTDGIDDETVQEVRLDGNTQTCWNFYGISYKTYATSATRTYKLQYKTQAGTMFIGFKRMNLFRRS